jgi:radical SAM superfamily enzyme YgiQ (UPF0313 family)
MSVLLVSANREHFPEPVYPVGPAYVAGALERAGHEVRLLDLGLTSAPLRSLRRAIRELQPSVVGLSLRNADNCSWPHTRCYLPWYGRLGAELRSVHGGRVVAGGSAVGIYPEELTALTGAHAAIAGDGEAELDALLGCDGDARIRGGLLDHLEDVGPPVDALRVFPSHGRYRSVGVQTARGCPYGCVYCTYPMLEGRRLRRRPVAAVLEELERLAQSGVEQVFIVDSSFNADEGHLVALCEGMLARGLHLRFSCYLQPRFSDPGVACLLARAGCTSVDFGTDSAAPEVLAGMGKEFGVDDLRRATSACREAGIDVCQSLIFGGPGETEATVAETVRVMDELRPTAVVAMVGVRVYPGTPLAARAAAENVLPPGGGLLSPCFYVAKGLTLRGLLAQVSGAAAPRRNWFLPGVKDWSGALGPHVLRALHKDGPLWRAFPTPRWYKLV